MGDDLYRRIVGRMDDWISRFATDAERGEKRPIHNTNRYEMTYEDANAGGSIHGGEIIKRMDTVAGHTAREYAAGPAVTASMDQAAFYEPVGIGDTLEVEARLDYAGTSSMMVHVDAYVRDYETGTRDKTTEAYFTFVAVDEHGTPVEVPELVLETDEERDRYETAQDVKRRLEEDTS